MGLSLFLNPFNLKFVKVRKRGPNSVIVVKSIVFCFDLILLGTTKYDLSACSWLLTVAVVRETLSFV